MKVKLVVTVEVSLQAAWKLRAETIQDAVQEAVAEHLLGHAFYPPGLNMHVEDVSLPSVSRKRN